MNYTHLFRCCFVSVLRRNYFTEKWIGDQTLVTILKHDYNLEFVSKGCINKYLPHLLFEGIHIHYEIKRNMIGNDGKKVWAIFYFFTRHEKYAEKFVTNEDWQNAYTNFLFIRSNRNNTNAPKRSLQDTSNIDVEESTGEIEQPKFKMNVNITDIIGDYFTSSEAKLLFNCRKDESADDCLSRRIDKFDSILNNKDIIASIVNNATEENCALNESQVIIISQRAQLLRTAYHFVLASDTSKRVSFLDCCKRSINHNKLNGLKIITYPQMIMRWNVIYRVHEKFPHPNYYIELGKAYVPLFLESFPEAKFKLRKWANRHLGIISCKAVANEMRRNIVPKLFDTYVRSLPPQENKPTYDSFLNCFGLKKICVSTIWRWMHYLGYTFDERKKCYFTDRHEDVENVTYRKKFVKKYFEYEKRAFRWVHITEEKAKILENDKDVRLIKNMYDDYEENHIKMRQYHIDTHPIFF